MGIPSHIDGACSFSYQILPGLVVFNSSQSGNVPPNIMEHGDTQKVQPTDGRYLSNIVLEYIEYYIIRDLSAGVGNLSDAALKKSLEIHPCMALNCVFFLLLPRKRPNFQTNCFSFFLSKLNDEKKLTCAKSIIFLLVHSLFK